jgi:peroxiredoxin Q/BCP
MKMTELNTGDQIPSFELTGDDGRTYTPESFRGKKLVIYFYPKDNTPGCTTEAVEFTALQKEYEDNGFVIVGVSPDKPETHVKFKEKRNLGFLLLSDPDKSAAEKFGAYGEKMLYGKISLGIKRSTFIFDEDGKLIRAYRNVRAKGHADKILCELK